MFAPDEGELHDYYGKVKNGKTLMATIDLFKDLARGQTVVANWKVKWNGYDERQHFWPVFWGILGFKKNYRRIPKENFIYLEPTDPYMLEKIARLTDCIIYLDEGHLYYDSYKLTKMDLSDRNAILFTGHFNRTIKIISQRSMAIHVTLRANVNRFFKCEKLLTIPFFNWTLFRKTEFQDMTSEQVDETMPEKVSHMWGRKSYYNLYDYKAMRGDTPRSQPNYTSVYKLNWIERLKLPKMIRETDVYADNPIPEDLKNVTVPPPKPE